MRSIFIRAGYPAFGIVNTLYQYHDALKQKQDLLEFQSHIAEKVDRYDKEVVDTSKIVDGLTVKYSSIILINVFALITCMLSSYF